MLLFRMAWSDALQGHAKCYFSEWHGQIPGRNTRSDAWQGCAECTFYSCMPVTTAHPLRQFTALWVTPIIRWSFQPPTFPTSCTHGLNLLHFQPYVHMDSTSYISNLMYTWTQPPTFPTPQTLGLKLLHFQPPCTHALKMPTFPTLPTLMPWRCPRFQHHQPSCTHALKLSIFPMLPTLVYTGNKKPSRQWEYWGKGGRGGNTERRKRANNQSVRSLESLEVAHLQRWNCINHAIHIIQGAKRFCFSTSTCWTSQGSPFIFVGGGCNFEIQTIGSQCLSQTTRKANGRGEATVYDRSPNQQLRWLCDRG